MREIVRWGILLAVVATVGYTTAAAGEPAAASAADQTAAEIARLIAQLGDADYFKREQAQAELEKIGFDAFDALSAATTNEDLEIALRARRILKSLRVDMSGRNDPPEVKRLLLDYEQQPREQKLMRMQALRNLPGDAGLVALCRLLRYEKSNLLAKYAAIAIMGRPSAEPLADKKAEVVRSNLQTCNRVSARWVTAWLELSKDTQAALNSLQGQIETEQRAIQVNATDASTEFVAALIRHRIVWLKRTKATAEADTAMRRLIDMESGDPDTLLGLTYWLIDEKAWTAFRYLTQRFNQQFQDNAILLYALAESQWKRDDKANAQRTVDKARKLNDGTGLEALVEHLSRAELLRRRGMNDWAGHEYRHVAERAPKAHEVAIRAYFGLSEMQHDQQQDLDAAKSLEKSLKIAEQQQLTGMAHRTLDEVRSRVHYFYACHYLKEGELDKQRDELVKGLEGESPDIDLLIDARACPILGEKEQAKVTAKIEQIASGLQDNIDSDRSSPIYYNQYAWLIGNTSKDPAELNKALEYSQRSLELSPNTAGYLDTLAHVYAARKDYDSAVRYQTQAVELEPAAEQIVRKLKFFQDKLAEQKKSETK